MTYSGDPQFPLSEVRKLGADREPCPVCGHPTGDCVPEGFVPPAGNALLRGEVSQIKTSQEKFSEELIYVEEDIIGERQITPFTKARVILATKGTWITKSKAEEFGIL